MLFVKNPHTSPTAQTREHATIEKMPEFDTKAQDEKLAEIRRREEEDLTRLLSEKYGLAYIDLGGTSINNDALRLVTEEEAREALLAPFARTGKKISVAIKSPNKDETRIAIKKLEDRGYIVTPFMTSTGGLEHAWSRYADISHATETKAGVLEISNEQIEKMTGELHSLKETRAKMEELLQAKQEYRVSRLLEILLAGALANGASDVHIEPEEAYVRLRYRLDGVLTDLMHIDRETYMLMLARIKLLSGLKINIRTVAQDGRFSISIGEKDIEIRTADVPGAYGESIVMRLLDPSTIALSMEDLGIHPFYFDLLEKEIRKPNGLILNTGPTGSGKTTTLYAFLKKIHRPEIKIITIENPVEYHLPGIVQTQVKEGYTFDDGLRSALRQDPDVIMLGEIREPIVASNAIQASITGHMVFSTVHTNTAAGAFPRLIDMGINPTILGSSMSVVMAQRLVRRLRKECAREVKLEGEKREKVMRMVDSIVNPEFIPKNLDTIWEPIPAEENPACEVPYSGRIGAFEILTMNEEIEKLVEVGSSENEIARTAIRQGMLTMEQDGILKVLAGMTTIDELERVLDLDRVPTTKERSPAEGTENV